MPKVPWPIRSWYSQWASKHSFCSEFFGKRQEAFTIVSHSTPVKNLKKFPLAMSKMIDRMAKNLYFPHLLDRPLLVRSPWSSHLAQSSEEQNSSRYVSSQSSVLLVTRLTLNLFGDGSLQTVLLDIESSSSEASTDLSAVCYSAIKNKHKIMKTTQVNTNRCPLLCSDFF